MKTEGQNSSIKIVLPSEYVGDTRGDYEASKKSKIPFIFAAYGFGESLDYDYKINSLVEIDKLVHVTFAK